MRIPRILAAHVVFLALPAAASAQGKPTNPEADSAEIKQVFTDYYENFTRHDPHAVSLCFAEDADFTNMFGVHNHGRQEIESKMASLFRGGLKESTRTDIVRSIRFFAPDIAVADAETTITGSKLADGSVMPQRKGLMIATLTRQNGRWLISTFHEAEFPAPRAAGANPPAASSAK